MSDRHLFANSMKRRLANWLKYFPPLRWGLTLGVRLFAPRHHVGAAAVVFNKAGQVLLVEHVFRPNYNWGLPGGWVEPGEDPADTIRRELKEELGLAIEVKQLLLCMVQGNEPQGSTPRSLAVAYYCGLADNDQNITNSYAFEVLSVKWVDPAAIKWEQTPFQHKAIALGKEIFDHEINSTGPRH